MSAGQIWEHADGSRWVEIQAEAMEPSGWRIMIPLVDLDDAPDAPPLVVTIGTQRARVHRLTSVQADELERAVDEVTPEQLSDLRSAAQRVLGHLQVG